MADEPLPPSNALVPVPLNDQSLDRAALERVLTRAAELQAHTAEPSEGMSEAQLEALGAEVGISSEHIRQAVAEERTRVAVPDERGVLGSWYGAALATASRVLRGNPPQILGLLDQWMQREEGLRPRRRLSDRLTWEARRDLFSNIQAGLNLRGRPYALTTATEIGATVVAVDSEKVVVRLDADFALARRRRVISTGIVGGGMLASAAGLVAVTTAIPGASVVVGSVVAGVWSMAGVAISLAIASAQRHKTARAQLALEQILDRLERGEIRGGDATSALLDLLVPTRR